MRQSKADLRAYEEWLKTCEQIRKATAHSLQESDKSKEARKARLRTNFQEFCRYYFPHYMDSDFGWFHKKAARDIYNDHRIFAILEWPREHAKSVFGNIMLPLFLYVNGELDGMVTVSANQDKAITLLSDIQAEFKANHRFIHDYGERAKMGDWRDGQFATTDGIGFWAFGRGQSPRGIRKGAKRPNYGVIDDIDDKIIVRNRQRVRDAVDWILEDLYGAMSIKGARIVVLGNRIHKYSILAHLVGDLEPEDKPHPDRYHLKVYALEDKRHRKSNLLKGRPAWIERFTIAELEDKINKMGVLAAGREYFHEHHQEGHVFRHEWIEYVKPLHYKKYDSLISYCDPSFRGSKDNDYKAMVLIGKKGIKIHILDLWIRQATVSSMVKTHYDWYDRHENFARYYMEANAMQDSLLDEFAVEAELRDYHMPIRGDKRAKPNKIERIENLQPLFERGLIGVSEKLRGLPDTQTFLDQLLGFPYGHDDGPDALEGGVYYVQRTTRSQHFQPRMGKYRRKTARQ